MDEIARAWVSFEADDFHSAEGAFRRILDTSGIDDSNHQQAQYGLGYALAFSGGYEEARQIFAQLYHQAGLQGDKEAEHRALHQVGMVERMAGNWMAAQTCFERERLLIEQLGNPDLPVAVNAYELGFVALHLGQFQASRVWFDLCLKCAEKTNNLIAVACAHRGSGDWYQHQDDVAAALNAWEMALRTFERANDSKGVRGIKERLAAPSEVRTQ